MLTSILLALALAIVLGGAASAWLWLVQRPRLERNEGLQLLAAMRWREFSRLVVEGLRSHGYEPEAIEDAIERGQDSVLHLRRDGREWLLACKQGSQYRVTPTVVGDMGDAVRFHGAQGGLVATPGTIEPEARKLAAGRIELFDGEALWPLVRPQLAESVHEELALKSRQATGRQLVLAWAGAATLGLVGAVLMPRSERPDPSPRAEVATAGATAPASRTPPATPADAAPADAAPVSEDEQRDDIIRLVTPIPGVERAMWSTRSTLMVYLTGEDIDPVEDICAVVERFETLRTSRLHLQPPKDSPRPARFLQCQTF